jgi:hypothetical protein
MKSDNSAWRVESDPVSQMVFAAVCTLVGLALVFFFFFERGDGDGGAPFPSVRHAVPALGVLMLAVGVWLAVKGGKTTVAVHPLRRLIVIERQSRWSSSRQTVPFGDIVSFQLGQSGDSEGGNIAYHVVMTLRSGPPINLFVGFFPGPAEPGGHAGALRPASGPDQPWRNKRGRTVQIAVLRRCINFLYGCFCSKKRAATAALSQRSCVLHSTADSTFTLPSTAPFSM